MRKLEVVRTSRICPPDPGYTEAERKHFNQLGYYRIGGSFQVLEEEEIPSDVLIELGAFGSYQGTWRSKFINWIPKERGGRAEEFT